MEKAKDGMIYNIFCQMAEIVDMDEFLINMYLYDPSLQLEDWEVDKYNELKLKLQNYTK